MVLIGLGIAVLASWGMAQAVLRIGPRLGFLDQPDDSILKVHHTPAVPLGGVAVFTGWLLGWAVVGDVAWSIVAIATLVVALGLVDDLMGLRPAPRLIAEAVLGVATVAVEATPLAPDSGLDLFIGALMVVVAINAVNLFDGLDALAGSAAVVGFAGLAWMAHIRGLASAPALLAAAGVVGFLVLNWPPARVFLGDNGSYLLGYLMAVFIMAISPEGVGTGLLVASLMLGVFLFDLSVTVLRRALTRRPLFSGDRNHTYDRVRAAGWSTPKIVAAAVIAEAGFGTAGVLIDRSGHPAVGVGVVAVAGFVIVLVAVLVLPVSGSAELSG